MRTVLENVTVLTMDHRRTVYSPGYVLVEDENIAEAGAGTYPGSADLRIDGRGGILMPGMVNTHSHISMIPFRTMGDDCPDRLRRFLFPLENQAMTRKLVYEAARYAICEMLLAGVTTCVDMYYFEDEVAKACEELGIRGYLGETIINQETCDSPSETYGGYEYSRRFLEEWKNHDRVIPIVAPHGTTTNEPDMLKKAHDLAVEYDTLYTIHASEMDYEMSYFRKEYGKTPTEFLDGLGILDQHMLAAHCIHMTEHDLELLGQNQCSVTHCLGSNTKAGKGVAPVKAMLQHGIPVGLGTDGPSSGNTLDLFTQFRLFASFHKTENRDRSLFPAEEIVALGTCEAAKTLHGETLYGSIEPGKRADLVLVETESVNMFPCYNPYSALVYSASASNVDTVMANGKIVVKDKKLQHADIKTIKSILSKEMIPFEQSAEEYKDII